MNVKQVVMVLAVPLFLSGCFGSYARSGRGETCERAIKQYTSMLRWQEAEKAALVFVDDSQRDRYTQSAQALRQRGVSVADYRILAQQCLSEQGEGKATVEFFYYIMPDSRLKTVTDHQKWRFREERVTAGDPGQGWKLLSPLPDFN